jgi:chaperonin cofactor prefoldin
MYIPWWGIILLIVGFFVICSSRDTKIKELLEKTADLETKIDDLESRVDELEEPSNKYQGDDSLGL